MDRNIIVCGNGPSVAKIDFRRVPDDVKVMRTTAFYFEEKYLVGKRVDYYVEYYKRIVDQYFNIRTINDKNEYDFDLENTWWTVMFENNKHFPTAKSCTQLIQEQPLIAEFRCFYEFYYGKYLPTGMQAIALACCLGFNNIYLTGFDLFSDMCNLHPWTDGKSVADRINQYERTSIYNTTGGSEKSVDISGYINKRHPVDMQIKFIYLLRKLFPATRFYSVSEKSAINEHVEMAPVLYETPWYSHQDKPADRTTEWYPLPEEMPSRAI